MHLKAVKHESRCNEWIIETSLYRLLVSPRLDRKTLVFPERDQTQEKVKNPPSRVAIVSPVCVSLPVSVHKSYRMKESSFITWTTDDEGRKFLVKRERGESKKRKSGIKKQRILRKRDLLCSEQFSPCVLRISSSRVGRHLFLFLPDFLKDSLMSLICEREKCMTITLIMLLPLFIGRFCLVSVFLLTFYYLIPLWGNHDCQFSFYLVSFLLLSLSYHL